jgi:uncharacterized small protein (DUF1192 family)
MKVCKILLLVLGLFFIGSEASAQLSKREAKEWKKKMRKMDPSDFKNLMDENNALKGKVSGLDGQVMSLQSRLGDKDAKISELQNEIKRIETELAASKKKAAAEEDKSLDISSRATRTAKGVEFRVQIGAYRNKDLTKFIDNGESFSGETDGNLMQYTLGYFTDYWEADKFKKYLREMGVKDAWIVPYKDGHRVPMRDVLEGVAPRQ